MTTLSGVAPVRKRLRLETTSPESVNKAGLQSKSPTTITDADKGKGIKTLNDILD